MKYKLIALDLDGTLLNSNGCISDETIKSIKIAIEENVQIIPATGRNISLICEEIRSIKGINYVIASNGAAVIDLKQNKIIFSEYIATDILKEIIEIIREYPIAIEFYADGYSYMDEDVWANPNKYKLTEENLNLLSDNHKMVKNILSKIIKGENLSWVDSVEKINIPFLSENMKNKIFNRLLAIKDKVKVTSSVKDNVEINAVNANKGNGLKEISKLLDINLEETVAIGDNNNDIEMLEMAGVGIAMGNASNDIKMKADFVTLNNDENGVGKAVLEILKKNI